MKEVLNVIFGLLGLAFLYWFCFWLHGLFYGKKKPKQKGYSKEKLAMGRDYIPSKPENLKNLIYKGVCPECGGYGKADRPCPLCIDEDQTTIRLFWVFKKHPKWAVANLKKIEFINGEVVDTS